MSRTATRSRSTKETSIEVDIDLDGTGRTEVSTGIPFYDHMLDQLGRHGGFDLTVQAQGDLHIDTHHTVEDVAIALGETFREALGDKAGIRRFASGRYPLDEALVDIALDLSGRAHVEWIVPMPEVLPLGDPAFEWAPARQRSTARLRHAAHERLRVLDDCTKSVFHGHQRLNLTRALVDRHHDRIPQQLLGKVISGVAIAAVDLKRHSRVLHRLLGAKVLQQRRDAARLPLMRSHEPFHLLTLGLLEIPVSKCKAQFMRHFLVKASRHRHRSDALNLGLHRFEVVRDHLVPIDRLPHGPAPGSILGGDPVGGFAEADTLESNPDSSVVHQGEHVLEAFAALAHQLRRRPVEHQRAGRRSMVPELLLNAAQLDDASPIPSVVLFVGRHQEHRQRFEPAARIA